MEKINKKNLRPWSGNGGKNKPESEVFIYIQECHRNIPGTNIGNYFFNSKRVRIFFPLRIDSSFTAADLEGRR